MQFQVKIYKDTKIWDQIQRRLLSSGDQVVDVGWWETQHPTGVPTAQVAAWNEEGHMNGGMFAGTITPARPFIRTGFIPSVKKILPKYAGQVFSGIATGKLTWSVFNKNMGKELVNLLQETILRWNTPPNSPTTIALKGFNDPLIQGGNMYDSVKYRIVRKG